MAAIMTRDGTVVSQMRDMMVQMIKDRKMQLGDQLPSEEKLTAEFKVSRPAVREALKLLEQDGIIRVEHGRGRFLMSGGALYVERPITTFESVTDMVAGLGYKTRTVLLSAEEIPADDTIAAGLHCVQGLHVLKIERVRYIKNTPIHYSLDFVRATDIPISPEKITGSLVNILRSRGQAPVASTAKVSATLLPEPILKQRGFANFGPALLITETCFTSSGYPILLARDYHRSKYFTFSFNRR